jgi:hypothetical protein
MVDSLAVGLLRANFQLEALAYHAGEKAAHRMLLLSRGFHDGSNVAP